LNRNRTLLLFIFATIVVTCIYESIISSFVTIPTELVVFRTLTELLDNGYKIAGYHENKDLFELKVLFQREGIPLERINSSLVLGMAYISDRMKYELLKECRSAVLNTEQRIQPAVRMKMLQYFKGVRCHSVVEPVIVRNLLDLYTGFDHRRIAATSQQMMESGILEMYSSLQTFITHLPYNRDFVLLEEKMEGRETPFSLTDQNIMSILIAWVVLIGTSIWTLTVETIYRVYCRRAENSTNLSFKWTNLRTFSCKWTNLRALSYKWANLRNLFKYWSAYIRLLFLRFRPCNLISR